MKALTLATVCLLATSTHAQDTYNQPAMPVAHPTAAPTTTIIAPAPQAVPVAPVQAPTPAPIPTPVPQNQAVAPAVFYAPASGDSTVTPQSIEVEVPVYKTVETKAQVQQIYTEIKDSQFFIELKPLMFSYTHIDNETNEENNGVPLTETDNNTTKFRLMPIAFKAGFENQNWGSFTEIIIADGADYSELVLFAKVSTLKIGGGVSLSTLNREKTFKVNGNTNKKTDYSETDFSMYFYLEGLLNDNSNMRTEARLFMGATYASSKDADLKLSGVSGFIQPQLDIFFKINKNFMIGYGGSLFYSRFTGDVSYSGTKGNSGIGNNFNIELDLIKTKFLF